ncbi:hypothetical protein HanPSC8_Chr17g0760891 [Helianthus annuus]|nr:hypothetical protein HanPSC8_Chr17g0760891 [Helianthus annuus]
MECTHHPFKYNNRERDRVRDRGHVRSSLSKWRIHSIFIVKSQFILLN